jgi:kynurenine formamidase
VKQVYLSHFLGPDTPFYGGDGAFHVEKLRSMEQGDSCNACRWSFPNHAGTHIDLPRHFVADGTCMNDYPADYWVFKNVGVIDISEIQPGFAIGPELLDNTAIAQDVELLLLKTGFGRHRSTAAYWQENPVVRSELADYLRGRFPLLRALGFDTISIASWTDRLTGREAHRAFLGGERPILLIEDMDLEPLDAKTALSRITVAPLLVREADASPCTVMAEVIE